MRGKLVAAGVEARIARVTRAQHGLITRTQLLDVGLGADAVDYRLAKGRLVAVHRGVYVVGPQRLSKEGWWLAAVLACGPVAVLSHAAAAAHWRIIPEARGTVDVTVPTPGGRSRRRGLRVHRRPLPLSEITRLNGIPVTAVARTVLDFAGGAPERRIERALDEAFYLGRLHQDALDATLARHPNHKGSRLLRRIVARQTAGATRTRSELEERFLDLCRRHGIPHPEVNVLVEGFLVDFFWKHARLVVETDGYAAHSRRSTFEADRARTLILQAAGYRVLRFSYRQVIEKADWVANHVERALTAG
jgi:very-short-patch-repair endonuclease